LAETTPSPTGAESDQQSRQRPEGRRDPRDPTRIDTSQVHSARVYDYMLGGTTNFAVDRQAAELLTILVPGGLDTVRLGARANRAFLVDVVHRLVTERGIDQFLDIGTGIPSDDNVHAVALRANPGARVVYVDYDPVVLAHAHQLLAGAPEGAVAYVDADLRDPDHVLEEAAATLDLSRPVALLLVAILHYVADADDPGDIVARLVAALAPGSYLVLSHLACDIKADEMATISGIADQAERTMQIAQETLVTRSRDEVAGFLDGLEVLEPGLVPLHEWPLPDSPLAPPADLEIPIYGAVARKP
jgi:O-methyltransferase involved in polyketide biosynthesis